MEKPFVEVLKEYRKKKKLTQQQLADKLNIERQTISNWERSKSFPNISLVNDLSFDPSGIGNLILFNSSVRGNYETSIGLEATWDYTELFG